MHPSSLIFSFFKFFIIKEYTKPKISLKILKNSLEFKFTKKE